MKPLRILLVLIEAPVPFGNAAARWFYVLLRELVARGHDVTCFAACSKASEMEEARRLFPAPTYDLRLYPFPERGGLWAKIETIHRPYSYMFSEELKRDLAAEQAKGFDILHLEHIWSGWLRTSAPHKTLLNVLSLYRVDLANKYIIGTVDRFRRWLLLHAESRLVRSFPNLLTLSDQLRAGLLSINPRANVTVVPIGIDVSLYPYLPDEYQGANHVVSVIGSMNWHPTYSAAMRALTRLWPAIKRQVPDARLLLVGWNARDALKAYIGEPDVVIEENVPDTRPYFEQTSVLLYAPNSCSGMKVKVLEAFAYGIPVVTTPDGVEGLPAIDGVHAGICDDDEGLVARTVNLLTNAAVRNRQRAAGRILLETHCGSSPTVDAIEFAYKRCGRG